MERFLGKSNIFGIFNYIILASSPSFHFIFKKPKKNLDLQNCWRKLRRRSLSMGLFGNRSWKRSFFQSCPSSFTPSYRKEVQDKPKVCHCKGKNFKKLLIYYPLAVESSALLFYAKVLKIELIFVFRSYLSIWSPLSEHLRFELSCILYRFKDFDFR